MIIAIDGTLASGKGTIARRIAGWYGLPHMDTGRLYRAAGLKALAQGVALDDGPGVAALAAALDLDDADEGSLRSEMAGQAASRVAVLPEVRAALFDLQRAFASQPGGAVLDGRDIGTVICPQADVKLWVDADVAVRARRRLEESRARGEGITLAEMVAQLQARDARDQRRTAAPAMRAADAILIDTTDLTIEAAVDRAIAAIEAGRARRRDVGRP